MTISSKSFKGFTMIELLMVLVIISVLAAVAIPIFTRFSVNAQVDDLKSRMLVAATAQEKYFIKNGFYSSIKTGKLKNDFGFPGDDVDIPMYFETGIYMKKGGEMFYWICGRRCVNGESYNWLFLPSLTSSKAKTDSSSFIELVASNTNKLKEDYGLAYNCIDKTCK